MSNYDTIRIGLFSVTNNIFPKRNIVIAVLLDLKWFIEINIYRICSAIYFPRLNNRGRKNRGLINIRFAWS